MTTDHTHPLPHREASAVHSTLLIVGAAILTALAAQVRIPLPFTPVPFTLQTLVVLLTGALLGWRRGALAEGLYLLWGGFGAPLFAGGALGFATIAGPTGGYLIGFIAAAGLAGWLITPGSTLPRIVLSLGLAAATVLLLGSAWLYFFVGRSFEAAFVAGVLPFIPAEFVKVVIATSIIRRFGSRV